MKKFLYCFISLILSILVFKTSAQESNANITGMVTVYGTVGTTTPEEAQNTQFTKVMFYPYDKITLKPGPPNAIRSVVPYGFLWQDSKSNSYTIELSDEYFYKVKLVQTAGMNGEGKYGYRSSFYHKFYDINESFLVDISTQPYLSKIGLLPVDWLDFDSTTLLNGTVQNENDAPVLSHVTAYRIGTDINGTDSLIAYTGKDTLNSDYSMRYIPQGEYILRVQPLDTLHEEGYYSETEGIVFAWQDATRIPITQNDQIVKDIVLKPSTLFASSIGLSSVEGMIFGRKPGTTELLGMKGVHVYLKDESSKIRYSTYTGNSGYYSIPFFIGGQKFTLHADKPGYSMHVSTIEAQDGVGFIFNGIMNAGSITSVDNAEETDKVEGQIYPNPTHSDQVMLQFPAHGKLSSLLITNTIGQLVFKTNIKTTDGINTFPLNVSKFPSGIYSVIISTGAETIRLPQLQVVR